MTVEVTCAECDGMGMVDCPECGTAQAVDCEECLGAGHVVVDEADLDDDETELSEAEVAKMWDEGEPAELE